MNELCLDVARARRSKAHFREGVLPPPAVVAAVGRAPAGLFNAMAAHPRAAAETTQSHSIVRRDAIQTRGQRPGHAASDFRLAR
mmetsp:Transcript_14805/g.49636  ORF Transcript_14805/g.49636 Transcript_14805/m.49636 type:complete len:84 (-) Transcript_14805:30-281(-)